MFFSINKIKKKKEMTQTEEAFDTDIKTIKKYVESGKDINAVVSFFVLFCFFLKFL